MQSWNAPVPSTASLGDSRGAVNDALEALRTCFSGTTAPLATVAGMLWHDTSDKWVKQRNAADSAWVLLFRTNDLPGAGLVHRASGWVTHAATTLTLDQVPANHVVLRVGMDVTEAFNSDGSDGLRAGDSVDDDRYGTDADVSTTGGKSVSAGVSLGRYSSSARTPQFKYVAGGSAATTGKALCWVEYALVTAQP